MHSSKTEVSLYKNKNKNIIIHQSLHSNIINLFKHHQESSTFDGNPCDPTKNPQETALQHRHQTAHFPSPIFPQPRRRGRPSVGPREIAVLRGLSLSAAVAPGPGRRGEAVLRRADGEAPEDVRRAACHRGGAHGGPGNVGHEVEAPPEGGAEGRRDGRHTEDVL